MMSRYRPYPEGIAMSAADLSIERERAVELGQPGESTTGLFGGNANWRGPIGSR